MLPPLPRCSSWASSSLIHPAVSAFPETTTGSACTSAFSRIARRLLTLRPAHSRGHQIVTVIRRLQTLRHLHACSGRFRLERSPGGACTRWKSAALSRRTRITVDRRRDLVALLLVEPRRLDAERRQR